MAELKRDFIWLECTVCGARNYRTERKMRIDMNKKSDKPPACMVNGKLEKRKFCRSNCRTHTLHRESRKK